jgi:hypothetical protein
MSDYTHFKHRHNFAVWAAARATQRRFTTTENLQSALEICGIVKYLEEEDHAITGSEDFDRLHRQWCRNILEHWRDRKVHRATFGRAAKLIAIYLKAMIVVGPYSDSTLARVAHPPIDRILLQNLAQTGEFDTSLRRHWRQIAWTELDESSYYNLLSQLRKCLPHGEPMWKLEKYWTVTPTTPPARNSSRCV